MSACYVILANVTWVLAREWAFFSYMTVEPCCMAYTRSTEESVVNSRFVTGKFTDTSCLYQ